MGILYETRNRVAYITINNPEKANTLDQTTMDELSQAWTDVWDDNDVRVAVITGSGDRHFSAGHNLASQENLSREERQQRAVEGIFWPASGTIRGTRTGVDGRSGDHYPPDLEAGHSRRQRVGSWSRVLPDPHLHRYSSSM